MYRCLNSYQLIQQLNIIFPSAIQSFLSAPAIFNRIPKGGGSQFDYFLMCVTSEPFNGRTNFNDYFCNLKLALVMWSKFDQDL